MQVTHLSLHTKQNTSVDIKNLNMRLSGGETFTVANDVDTIYASSLAKGASAPIQ